MLHAALACYKTFMSSDAEAPPNSSVDGINYRLPIPPELHTIYALNFVWSSIALVLYGMYSYYL